MLTIIKSNKQKLKMMKEKLDRMKVANYLHHGDDQNQQDKPKFYANQTFVSKV